MFEVECFILFYHYYYLIYVITALISECKLETEVKQYLNIIKMIVLTSTAANI